MACIFKKGDSSCPDNYRPISLLAVGYKIFASILLQRLLDGDADKFIWDTQFGFRPKVGTSEAVFIARRSIEKAWATKGGKTVLLALDWSKAFDCISPDALNGALLRFGVPSSICDMISVIYSGRKFHVCEAGHVSKEYS